MIDERMDLRLCGDLRRDLTIEPGREVAALPFRKMMVHGNKDNGVLPSKISNSSRWWLSWARVLSEMCQQDQFCVGICEDGKPLRKSWYLQTDDANDEYSGSSASTMTPCFSEVYLYDEEHAKLKPTLRQECLLSLVVNGNSVTVCYDATIFVAETMQIFLDRVIHHALGNRGMPIEELEQIRVFSSEPNVYSQGAEWPLNEIEGKTIVDIFLETATKYPDQIAIVPAEDKGVPLTFAQLRVEVARVARVLARYVPEGVQVLKENPVELANGKMLDTPLVALVFERSVGMVIAMLAAQMAGFGYVPIERSYPEERVKYILNDSKATMILCDMYSAEEAVKFSSLLDERVVRVQNVTDITSAPAITETNTDRTSFEHVRITSSEDVVYVLYTSGSTGVPKGVALSHRAALTALLHSAERLGSGGQDNVILCTTTYVFDLSVVEIYSPLLWGSTMKQAAVSALRDPDSLLASIEQEPRPTWIQSTPSLLKIMLASMILKRAKHCIRNLVVCGELLRQDIARDAFAQLISSNPDCGLLLHNAWGPTEAAVYGTAKTFRSLEDIMQRFHLSVGTPLGYRGIYILKPNSLELAPLGSKGEICIIGPGLAWGYLNRPDANGAFAIWKHPFRNDEEVPIYRCGDLVRWRPDDGELEFFGRVDNQVKIRGYRIELGEVEAAMVKYNSSIQECAVLAQETDSGLTLVAYISPMVDKKTLNYGSLAPYMIPSIVVTLLNLPKNQSGKVDRKMLLLPSTESRIISRATHPLMDEDEDLTDTESRILQMVRKIMPGQGSIMATSNYFLFGATSVTVIELRANVNTEFNVDLPATLFFDSPTAKQIAEAIESKGTIQNEATIVVQMFKTQKTNKAKRKNIFLLHSAGGVTYTYFELISEFVDIQQNTEGGMNVYGVQDPYLKDSSMKKYSNILDMVEDYWNAIKATQPKGPYYFAGHSLGGLLCAEIAHRAELEGKTVGGVFLIDSAFVENATSPFEDIWKGYKGGFFRQYYEQKRMHEKISVERLRKQQDRRGFRYFRGRFKAGWFGLVACCMPRGHSSTSMYKEESEAASQSSAVSNMHATKVLSLVTRHIEAAAKYGGPLGAGLDLTNPQPTATLKCPIVYFCAVDDDTTTCKEAHINAWKKISSDPSKLFEVFELDFCDHTTILLGKFGKQVATKMTTYMNLS